MPTLIKRTLSLVTCASWKSPDDEFMFINTHECSAFLAKMLPSDMALIRLFIGLAMISTIQTSTRISLNQNGYSNILFAVSPEVPPSESEKIIENIQVIYFKFKWNEWRTICEFFSWWYKKLQRSYPLRLATTLSFTKTSASSFRNLGITSKPIPVLGKLGK